MPTAYIFNASAEQIKVSVNNGDFFSVDQANATSWIPSISAKTPEFVNNTNPGMGQFGLGTNQITMYPATTGPSHSVNFELNIPKNVTVRSLQLYLFWKDAEHVAWAALNGGQLISVSDLQNS
ncbi:TPA: hypothetical protein ACIPUI_000241 [Citrobacter freundii]